MRPCRSSLVLVLLAIAAPAPAVAAGLRAGVAEVDASPATLPCIVNGGFLQAKGEAVRDPLFARALVLDDGRTRLAICLVDSCMMPRDLIDEAKRRASESAGIPADRMLVAATHTHTAPAAMGALGTPPDPDYVALLPGKIADAIAKAAADLRPAEAGWASVDLPELTHCRRWIRRSDRVNVDPFGASTVRAMMHPGYDSPDVIGPSGPVDSGLSILAVRSADGEPIAVLANYSMHYFGTSPVSADYFGEFARNLKRTLGPGVVAMMTQGTSGDQHWMNYSAPRFDRKQDEYAETMAAKAIDAYKDVEFRGDLTLAMAETTLTLDRRTPDADRLAWARPIVEAMGDRVPSSLPEVYAKEAIYLHDDPRRELKLQAIRVGDLGIAAIPNEVYGISGLKIKERSPLSSTFTIELANGSEGYIPPPEQHPLGGYTTWPARTAALEVQAEPRIVDRVLGLLEEVSGKPRRPSVEPPSPYADALLASRPLATWRLGELEGPTARDLTGGLDGRYEPGLAPGLPGVLGGAFAATGVNRALHVAGGRLIVPLDRPLPAYTVEFWLWNGMPTDARPVTGYLASIGPDGFEGAPGDHLGLGGTQPGIPAGVLFAFNGNAAGDVVAGRTPIAPRSWHHVAFVRDGARVRAYLDGSLEFDADLPDTRPAGPLPLFLGGRSDRFAGLEGKLDEAALHARALSAEEVAARYEASGDAAGPAAP